MKIFTFDEAGLLVGSSIIKKPAEGESLPEMSTEVPPPELAGDYFPRWNGADWTVECSRLTA